MRTDLNRDITPCLGVKAGQVLSELQVIQITVVTRHKRCPFKHTQGQTLDVTIAFFR